MVEGGIFNSPFHHKDNAMEKRVYQHNKLIEASHTLTLNEKRLVLLAASKLDSRKPEPKSHFIKISASEFGDVFDIVLRSVYRILAEAGSRLYSRNIKIYSKTGKVAEELRWVYHIKYHEGDGVIELGFSPTVTPYLTRLNREFTYYQLRQIGSLDSFYSIRIYELCSQFLQTGIRTVTLERIRTMLDIGDKYPLLKDFKRYVIVPAIEDVNQHTNLEVKMEMTRKGRKVTGFTFLIERKVEDGT